MIRIPVQIFIVYTKSTMRGNSPAQNMCDRGCFWSKCSKRSFVKALVSCSASYASFWLDLTPRPSPCCWQSNGLICVVPNTFIFLAGPQLLPWGRSCRMTQFCLTGLRFGALPRECLCLRGAEECDSRNTLPGAAWGMLPESAHVLLSLMKGWTSVIISC